MSRKICLLEEDKRDINFYSGMLYLPVQLVPFPIKPGLQEQLNDPSVLLQMAWVLQLSVFKAHSSISKQR